MPMGLTVLDANDILLVLLNVGNCIEAVLDKVIANHTIVIHSASFRSAGTPVYSSCAVATPEEETMSARINDLHEVRFLATSFTIMS
jgi:hypothetical protein